MLYYFQSILIQLLISFQKCLFLCAFYEDEISLFSFLVRFSGPTIHFVDEHYDTGRILAQIVVPVLPKDSPEELAARVLREVRKFFINFKFFVNFHVFFSRDAANSLLQT